MFAVCTITLLGDVYKPYGRGVYNYASGDVYVGEWKGDKLDGCGVYNYASGDVYIGEWKGDKLDGRGVYNYANGGVYVGELKGDKRLSFVIDFDYFYKTPYCVRQ